MKLSEYSTYIDESMRFHHDTQVRFTIKTGRKVLEDRLIHITEIGGAMTIAGFMYNALTMSGGVHWWDPGSGESIKRPKVHLRTKPEFILTGKQLCDCAKCKADPRPLSEEELSYLQEAS